VAGRRSHHCAIPAFQRVNELHIQEIDNLPIKCEIAYLQEKITASQESIAKLEKAGSKNI